jgi:hypothetical protein
VLVSERNIAGKIEIINYLLLLRVVIRDLDLLLDSHVIDT